MLRRVVRVGLVAGIVLAGSAVLAAEVSITTPDSDGDVGWGSSLVLDVDGHPVIAYQDRTNRTLKVMHCNDPYCAGGDESITTPDPEGGGYSPSIVLDAVGHPVIAHARGGLVATATRVVRCNDPDCAGGDESVTAHHLAGLGDVSLVLDAAGNPVLAQTELESDLYLMRCNDPNCAGGDESITTPAGRGGDEVSLTLDALDNPVFAYGGSGPTLGIVHCNDPNCAGGDESIGSPSLGITFDVAEIGSIVLDAAGNPVISYVESISSFDPLRVLHCNDPNCVGGTSRAPRRSAATGRTRWSSIRRATR